MKDLRIQIMKDTLKAKQMRELTKELPKKDAYKLSAKREELDKKIIFYENFINQMKKGSKNE